MPGPPAAKGLAAAVVGVARLVRTVAVLPAAEVIPVAAVRHAALAKEVQVRVAGPVTMAIPHRVQTVRSSTVPQVQVVEAPVGRVVVSNSLVITPMVSVATMPDSMVPAVVLAAALHSLMVASPALRVVVEAVRRGF